MPDQSSTFALITGATKGIGKAIAAELASRGYNLLLTARSGSELEAVSHELSGAYDIRCLYFPADLASPDAPQRIFDWVQQNQFPVSILVNNAGYTIWDLFETTPLPGHLALIEVNINAVVRLTHLFIPILRKQTRSFILNTASTSAFQAVPSMSVYAASKAFIILFTRGLRLELKNSGISVTCLIPGTTHSNFMNRARMDALRSTAEKFSMQPGDVARMAVRAMLKGKAQVVPGFANSLSETLTAWLPKSLSESIAAGIYLKHKK